MHGSQQSLSAPAAAIAPPGHTTIILTRPGTRANPAQPASAHRPPAGGY
jgi:hypothetical protein